ncbi:MAG: DUF2163 domain-containing protein [Beijerinckiaceae bacterium]
MRTLSPAMTAALMGGATTLARCWKLTRRDALVLGFTDHDRDLTVDGTVYAALTGVEGSQLEADYGFAVGGGEISGALMAEGLAEPDLAKGLWDSAHVEVRLADWSNPDAFIILEKGVLGEVRRKGHAFTAEVRSPAHRLDEERGRIYAAACSATLGDTRCQIALNTPAWSLEAPVTGSDGPARLRAAATAHAAGLFSGGQLVWLTGSNAGASADIAEHAIRDGSMCIALWSRCAAPIMPGDLFRITAGCDRQFSTCRARFSNTLNFRGFPHMPGNDRLVQIAREGEPGMDGGSLFR